MISIIQPPNFLKLSTEIPVIDVRAPVEFNQGHIPGALSIPLFNDHERALVGTAYHQSGQKSAIVLGLDLALPKTGMFIDQVRNSTDYDKILLHCWRGGMRSASMAQVFEKAGYEVYILEGGYKSYRQFIRQEFSKEASIVVLGGFTGSGKTELLKSLEQQGEQVIDLEKLASHKGSVFGSFGQPGQPTNEQFENNLYSEWSSMDFSKPVWLEDESRMIGNVALPEPVFSQIQNGILVLLEVEKNTRVERLVQEYARFEKEQLGGAISKIKERLGGTRTAMAINALENKRYSEVADIVLEYYDKAYQFSIDRRKGKLIYPVSVSGKEPSIVAKEMRNFLYKQTDYASHLP